MKSLLWLKGIKVAVQMAYPEERSAVDVCLTAWVSETIGLLQPLKATSVASLSASTSIPKVECNSSLLLLRRNTEEILLPVTKSDKLNVLSTGQSMHPVTAVPAVSSSKLTMLLEDAMSEVTVLVQYGVR